MVIIESVENDVNLSCSVSSDEYMPKIGEKLKLMALSSCKNNKLPGGDNHERVMTTGALLSYQASLNQAPLQKDS